MSDEDRKRHCLDSKGNIFISFINDNDGLSVTSNREAVDLDTTVRNPDQLASPDTKANKIRSFRSLSSVFPIRSNDSIGWQGINNVEGSVVSSKRATRVSTDAPHSGTDCRVPRRRTGGPRLVEGIDRPREKRNSRYNSFVVSQE